ncbi:MAG: hypothetical protein P0S96_03150 [Simkaniaceae bacterium]|nr:hypothetical protein [Candidatus Sacchlamyda saccharinae]
MLKYLLLLFPCFCFALEEKPWFGDCLEFHLRPLYEYNFFDKVDNAVPSQKGTFNTHVLAFGLDTTVPDTWNYELELEFADTTPVSFGYRSFAMQVRKLWLDDVCGDCVSLTTGLSYRDASTRMRKALSTPYHARANFELNTAIGKEWSHGCYWNFRAYGVFAVGQGTEGSPWLRGDFFLWYNICDCHQFSLFAKSYWGLGDKTTVPIDNFKNWSRIGHQSIDIGGSYRYGLGVWGWLRFDYLYRPYARSYPEQVHFFIFSLDFPFSIF